MRGVLLAGGSAARLRPLTKVTNKHLLPVYKKPMIYYPLETFIKAGIKDILIVTGGEHVGDFFRLLGSGKEWGARFSYEIQEGSEGTGAALLLAEDFARDEEFLVILGDNVIHEDIGKFVKQFRREKDRFDAKILVAKAKNPQKYGVVEFQSNKIINIVEKPRKPNSSYVNTGLWMFKPEVFTLLKKLKKSSRGEYEVTDVLSHYAKQGTLSFSALKSKWTDAGSFESLYAATVLMKKMEDRQRKKKK
ncbi:MAG: NTP transferase domain-containing protein [Candidatus Omnitrophica bacterium]|nr:NTP transferase domain-containing protein [Candidatus Omnitrophota bacterium]